MTENLRERLDEALTAFIPAPPAVDETIRSGLRIRWRRRALAAACVAALAATAVVVPLSFHPQASPAPATGRGGYTVTVEPPGPHAPEGLIATGTVNGKSWQYTVGAPIKQGPHSGEQVVTAAGPAFVPVQQVTTNIPFPGAGTPTAVIFFPQWGEQTAGLYGAVRSGVDHLTVRLTNGTTLTLHPVAAFGQRLVAFAVPRGAVIVRVTAYSRTGVISTATPYYDYARNAQWDVWFKPGEHSPPRASGKIGSGVLDGQAWSVSAATGPWGVCFIVFGNSFCEPLTSTNFVMSGGSGRVEVSVGEAGPTVATVVIFHTPGQDIPVRLVTIGGRKFFAVGTSFSTKSNTLYWSAYDATGRKVASGEFAY